MLAYVVSQILYSRSTAKKDLVSCPTETIANQLQPNCICPINVRPKPAALTIHLGKIRRDVDAPIPFQKDITTT
jgi:hypothetical protein